MFLLTYLFMHLFMYFLWNCFIGTRIPYSSPSFSLPHCLSPYCYNNKVLSLLAKIKSRLLIWKCFRESNTQIHTERERGLFHLLALNTKIGSEQRQGLEPSFQSFAWMQAFFMSLYFSISLCSVHSFQIKAQLRL